VKSLKICESYGSNENDHYYGIEISISCLLELSSNTPVVSSSQSDGLISREACVVFQGIFQLPTVVFQGCGMLTDYTKHQYKYTCDKYDKKS